MTGDRRPDPAAEARDLVRRAVGDAAGLTVKGQIRRAAQNLGYALDGWRVREAWYGRAGRWSAAVLHDLRLRITAWRARERAKIAPAALAQRLAAMREGLAELQRRFGELEDEVGRVMSADRRGERGGASDDAR